jgi:hypothetical protein
VGIRNHFEGVFQRTGEPGWGRLQWRGAVQLRVRDKGRIVDEMPVTWVVPAEHVGVHDAPPAGPNVLPATLAEALPLGDIALCRFEVAGTGEANQPTARLQRGELTAGRSLFLQLDPEGVHIMPRRHGADDEPDA